MERPVIQRLDRAGREAGKRALRHYGEITSALRPGPGFVIIGAKRGGTTSLYNYLLEHPSLRPLFPGRQHIKGVHYFDSEFGRGLRWYRSHYPLVIGGRHIARPWAQPAIASEASPYYLFHPLAAQRLVSEFPDVRLIVLLRDPVERAYSHYKERVRHGAEPLSFEEALDAEEDRLRGEAERIAAEADYRSVAHEHQSYLAQGRYLDMFPRWFDLFPREQFYIAASEDFYNDPGRVVNEVWSFLSLAPAGLRSQTRHNYHPAPDLPSATRRHLQAAFAEHNRELERLLGRQLPWPSARACPVDLGRRERPSEGMARQAEEDPIAELSATTTTPRGALRRTRSRLKIRGARPKKPIASTLRTGLSSTAAANERHSISQPPPPGSARWPSVTVVVATRDRPALLERAVRSIVAQSYPGDVECVVVFDQSSPAPMAVEVPPGRRLRLVTNTRSPGLAGARNSGILASDSGLVAFCDDDDAWDLDKLRIQVERLESTSAEFVACGTRFHCAGRVVVRAAPSSVELGQLLHKRFPELGAPTFVIRRDALERIGLVDEKIPGSYGEDYDLLLRAARRGPIVSVEQPLVDVYWHEQSYFAERWQTIMDALRYLLEKHPEFTANRAGLARIQGQIAFAQAALAHRRPACQTSWQALRNNPLERRAYLALAVASGLVSATSIVRFANRRGHGI